jgi:hypothetical protein
MDLQHLAVQEQQRTKRLVVRGRLHPALVGEHGQIGLNILRRHLLGVSHGPSAAMPADERRNPVRVGLLRPQAVVPAPQLLPHLVNQPDRLQRPAGFVRPISTIHKNSILTEIRAVNGSSGCDALELDRKRRFISQICGLYLVRLSEVITRYPILEFLSKAAGTYKSGTGEFELELRKNGYDFLLLTKSKNNRSQIYGVIGVAGGNLELHASVGLPNIIVFNWPHALNETTEILKIDFKEADTDLGISIAFDKSALTFSLSIGDKEKSTHALQKA